MIPRVMALVLGIGFGILMVKSEVSSWFRIQRMFRFEEAHMYLIMGAAVTVGAISVWIIRKWKLTSLAGSAPSLKAKKFQTGTIIGGLLFGCGWAITGACPGPIYAQLGKGDWMALCSFAGALCGAYLYAVLHTRLPH